MTQNSQITGAGIGLRRHYMEELLDLPLDTIPWFEFAPENYLLRGGKMRKLFELIAARTPLVAHGLQLSIGSLDELNWDYLKKLKIFLRQFNIPWFSDHICFASRGGDYLHDLLPMPFIQDSIDHVAERARIVQDFLEVPFALENASFYVHTLKPQMTEWDFVAAIIDQSGVSLMLDVNNIYVNAINHDFDPRTYIKNVASLPIIQLHIAGHDRIEPNFIIDTHSEPICHDVWELLEDLAKLRPLPPVLVERDGNFPPLDELLSERQRAQKIWEASHQIEGR